MRRRRLRVVVEWTRPGGVSERSERASGGRGHDHRLEWTRPGGVSERVVLDKRALNRATLQRQLLLERSGIGVVAAVEQLVGLNAQAPNDPYLALASRLSRFEPAELTAAIENRSLVRAPMMRATQHLVLAADYRWLRPVLQPLLARVQRNVFGRRTKDVDLTELVADARRIMAGTVRPRPELGRLLAADRPGADSEALAWSVQYLLPVVHPAPSGTWDTLGTIPLVLAEEHLGGALDAPNPRRMVRRYLAAFGPATVTDIRAWSGVSGLKEVLAEMRHELRTFRDESGRELVDLPDAPHPDPETPVPVRLLAPFDNLLLGYADRTRLMTDEVRRRGCVGDLVASTLLIDGMVSGIWELDRAAGVVTVRPFVRLVRPDVDAVVAEGARVPKLAAAGVARPDVRVLRPT